MNKIAEKNDALDAFIANYCIDHPLSGSVRIDFKSFVNPDSNIGASSVGGKTVYTDGKSYYVDENNRYPLPVKPDESVVEWLFTELKQYGNFVRTDAVTVDGVLCDVLTAAKTELISKDEVDGAYNEYEIFLPYKDGKNYILNFFDFEDDEKDIFGGNAPEELLYGAGLTVDFDGGVLYNEKTNESYGVVITLLKSLYKRRKSPPEKRTDR